VGQAWVRLHHVGSAMVSLKPVLPGFRSLLSPLPLQHSLQNILALDEWDSMRYGQDKCCMCLQSAVCARQLTSWISCERPDMCMCVHNTEHISVGPTHACPLKAWYFLSVAQFVPLILFSCSLSLPHLRRSC